MLHNANYLPPPPDDFVPGIPHTLHAVWLGPSHVPAEWEESAAAFLAMHPGWNYRLWTDVDVDGLLASDPFGLQPFGLRAAFDKWPNFGPQSDILRLLILYLFGGLYLDVDCRVHRPMGALLDSVDALVGATFPGEPFPAVLVQNAVIAASARHPWLTLTLTELRMAMDAAHPYPLVHGHDDLLMLTTGPGLLSRTLMQYRRSPSSLRSDVAVIPARRMFPAGPHSGATPIEFPDTLLIHKWTLSWLEQRPSAE